MALASYPQALLEGGHQMDLSKFRHMLWDILSKGDSVKVSSVLRYFHFFYYFFSLSCGYQHSNWLLVGFVKVGTYLSTNIQGCHL